jgi:hypothetical protein
MDCSCGNRLAHYVAHLGPGWWIPWVLTAFVFVAATRIHRWYSKWESKHLDRMLIEDPIGFGQYVKRQARSYADGGSGGDGGEGGGC